jgi:signal transduction histidine kinase
VRPADPSSKLPADVQALQAEVLRLRETLRTALLEKDRVLRLLRNTNTDLHTRVQGQTRQLTALNQLITTINASLNLREVAAAALAGLHQLLSVEAAALALKSDDAWIHYFLTHPANLMEAVAGLRLRPGEGLLGRVIESGQAFFSNDLEPAALTDHDQVPGLTLRSVVCQPVIARERVIGAVQLVNKWSGPFVDADRAFVETVTGSLAVAVENARVYQEAQAQLRALEQAHARLVETQTQLVQSARQASIGQLAAGLAHELNNPLGIILGFGQLVGQRAQDEQLRSYGAAIERETRRVQRIVSDLLSFARPRGEAPAGFLPPTQAGAHVDLRHVLSRAEQLLGYQLARDNLLLVEDVANEPCLVTGDADQLLQVVLNLMQNARQAMAGGGRLYVRVWNEAARVHLAVRDSGPGIPPDDLDRIFDPFFTTKAPGQGTGLGLTISAGIVQRHGGELAARNRAEGGAEFVMSLPQAVESG